MKELAFNRMIKFLTYRIQKLSRGLITYTTHDDHGKRYYLHCVVARERLLFWVENKTLNTSKLYCCEVLFLAVIKEFSVLLEIFL